MSVRRISLIAGLAMTVGIILPGTGLTAAGGSDLPLKGSGSGTYTVDLATGQGSQFVTGQFSHLGLATGEIDYQVVLTSPATYTLSGSLTLTAANGDRISATCTGTGSFTSAVDQLATADCTSVAGTGTGRLAGAAASLTLTVFATRLTLVDGVSTGVVEATAVGRLSYG